MNFFQKKVGPFKFWWFCPIWLLLIIGIIVGSFCDLQISQSIADVNSLYGKFFECYGEFFGYGMLVVSAAVLSSIFMKEGNAVWQWLIGILISVVLIAIAIYYMSWDFSGQPGWTWKFPKIYGYLGSGVLYIALYFVAFYLVDRSLPTKTLLFRGLAILLAFALPTILVSMILKGAIYRPRFRAMTVDNAVNGTTAIGLSYYKNWWQWDFWNMPEAYDDMIADGTALTDYFKSWPSGHTACAGTLLALPLYVSILRKPSEKKNAIAFAIGVIYMFMVAFSRVRIGAHFLSDVSWGGLFASLGTFFMALAFRLPEEKMKLSK